MSKVKNLSSKLGWKGPNNRVTKLEEHKQSQQPQKLTPKKPSLTDTPDSKPAETVKPKSTGNAEDI